MTGQLVPANPTPPPPKARGIRLNSLVAIQREMRAVYVQARTRQLPTSEATRLTYLLTQLAQLHQMIEFETRLAALEGLVGKEGVERG